MPYYFNFITILKLTYMDSTIWLYEADFLGFLPQSIIDEEEEPDYYLNAQMVNDNLIVVSYGKNVTKNDSELDYQVCFYKIQKEVIDKYVINTSLDSTDFLTYSNLSDLDKTDDIQLAFRAMEIVNPTSSYYFRSREETRNKAHGIFTKNN
jgi:hypothetical protein